MTELELRQAVKDAGVKLLETGLTQGTWGNISVRLDDKRMIVTPSGMDYIRLTPDKMVVVDIETLEYEGKIKPTSERKIHAAVYRDRKDVNAVIHSHPLAASSVAAARRNLSITDEREKTILGGDVKVGKYGLPGTKKLTAGTVEAVNGRNACFMANHGALAVGASLDDAFEVLRTLEEASRQFLETEAVRISGAKEFSLGALKDAFIKSK